MYFLSAEGNAMKIILKNQQYLIKLFINCASNPFAHLTQKTKAHIPPHFYQSVSL